MIRISKTYSKKESFKINFDSLDNTIMGNINPVFIENNILNINRIEKDDYIEWLIVGTALSFDKYCFKTKFEYLEELYNKYNREEKLKRILNEDSI